MVIRCHPYIWFPNSDLFRDVSFRFFRFFPVFVPLNDEIVSTLAGDDAHVFLLYEFKHGQKEKYGMDTIITYLKYFIKRNGFFRPDGV